MSKFELHRVSDPAEWKGADWPSIESVSTYATPEQIQELESVCAALEARGLHHEETDRSDFPFVAFAPLLEQMRHELADGKGFFLLRGLPLGTWTKDRARLAAWGLGTWLGTHVSQTVSGQRLTDVTDTSAVEKTPRQYKTSQELRLHTDPASDLIGLACIQPAKSGGYSVLASAIAVHNAMFEQRPDLLEKLYEGFIWHRYGEGRPEDGPYTREPVPIFAMQDGRLSCRYVRAPIAAGHRDAGIPLTDAQIEALDMLDALASSPELRISFKMEAGDLLMVNNLAVLHARTRFEDFDEPERKRHILRLWLEGWPGFRPVPRQLNYFNGGECGIRPAPNQRAEYDVEKLYSDRASGGVARLGIHD